MFILWSIAVVSFESTGGSGSTIQVTESDGSLEVDLIFSKPVDVNITVFLLATNITATGLHNTYILCINNYT